MIGIEERDTQSGIHVFRVHYSANPLCRTDEWKRAASIGVPGGLTGRDWRREREIDWTVASGLPVYADSFSRELHVAASALAAYPDRPIYRGWDFGLSPSCVWVQVDPMGRVNVLGELVTWDGRSEMKQMGLERFIPGVLLRSNEDWPNHDYKDKADAAGWQRAQTDERTCVQIMHGFGIHPTAGLVAFEARRRAVVGILDKMVGGRPALAISPTCQMLIEGFQGAYRYEEIGETGEYRKVVEKNAWSHPMNALEYVLGSLYAPAVEERSGEPEYGSSEWLDQRIAEGRIRTYA